ncbi:SusD/RagB family nutrient-binding outer membrane lipoprotein [Sphingobacterium chungjuense]|uniref:SusD/RagB family nutrient-binding outer membrane lipoprotein n=1 Tax=Sphingobacterium chungjuense TaxID=2675553 RepID=UPI001407395F|nr:SusD/RagB family nutrient-binding outer membrane lipoprotein [Sphingobacterium chungjuense]
MKNLIKIVLLGIVCSSILTSCNKDFQEINTNPNTSPRVQPENLLAPALAKSVSANMSRSQRITNELMQVTVNMGDGEGRIFRYDIRTNEADHMWNNLYVQLRNFRDIYEYADELNQPEYKAIAQISEVWLFSILTDIYGDIPYSQALLGRDSNVVQPVFDKQQAIYLSLFEKLEEANTLLNGIAFEYKIKADADPVFNGQMYKWRLFGNSLYLRLALRLAHKTELNTVAIIKKIIEDEPIRYPIMRSNDDSAILRWTGVSPYVSPFATWRPADWYGPKSASFFTDKLSERSDPRIVSWVSLFNGDYLGVPSGYPIGQPPVQGSALHTDLMSHPLLGNILNYGELQLILAEAAIKGYITTGSAREYYERGTKAGIELWGHQMPSFYLSTDLTAWDDNFDEFQKMELIHLQKYYALFFTDMQSWFEFRRTGHPVLPIRSGHLNGGKMPVRLNYPVYVQNANRANYQQAVAEQGPDNFNTPVWWQKP